MPHVNVYYKMIVPEGHRRQPRNRSFELNLSEASGGDIHVGGSISPAYLRQLPYTHNGSNGLAQLLFWSVTDGINGQVYPPTVLSQRVDSLSLTITAWYFPISGPFVPSEGSAIIDDAFSASQGDFIDDTFVNVTSDPTLTNDANVIGLVPTNVAQTLVANNSVASTTEPFAEWILNGGFMPVGATTLNIDKGTSGSAIAVYQQPLSRIQPLYPGPYIPYEVILRLMGILTDFPRPPKPEPWPEFTVALELVDIAKKVSPQLQDGVLELASKQITTAAETFKEEIKRLKKKPSEK